jgi:hypothetical protein
MRPEKLGRDADFNHTALQLTYRTYTVATQSVGQWLKKTIQAVPSA